MRCPRAGGHAVAGGLADGLGEVRAGHLRQPPLDGDRPTLAADAGYRLREGDPAAAPLGGFVDPAGPKREARRSP